MKVRDPAARTSKVLRFPPKRKFWPRDTHWAMAKVQGRQPPLDGEQPRSHPSTAAPTAVSGMVWGLKGRVARTSNVPRSPTKRRLWPRYTHWAMAGVRRRQPPVDGERLRSDPSTAAPAAVSGRVWRVRGPLSQNIESVTVSTEAPPRAQRYQLGHGGVRGRQPPVDGAHFRSDPSTADPPAVSGTVWGVRGRTAKTSKVPRSPPKRRLWPRDTQLAMVGGRGRQPPVDGEESRSDPSTTASAAISGKAWGVGCPHPGHRQCHGLHRSEASGQEIPSGQWTVSSLARIYQPRRPPRSVEGCGG